MNYDTSCKILDISQENEVTLTSLKKSYRILALKYHPDKNKSQDAAQKFQEVQNAYEYLLRYLEEDDFTSEEEDEYNEEFEKPGSKKGEYNNMLFSFIKKLIPKELGGSVLQLILNKISTMCEKNAIELLEKVDKTILIKIHETLTIHGEVFHFSHSFFNKIENLIREKTKNDECIILNPELNDLFENNLYKLKLNNSMYAVPLWHHELIYDASGSDVYVKCNPIVPENITIDSKNNITVCVSLGILDIWNNDTTEFKIGKTSFFLKREQLVFKKRQTIVLERQGISKINTVDVYDISKKADIIVDLTII